MEFSLAALLCALVVAVVLQGGFWAHAQSVATAAAQEAARTASAQGGDLEHGLTVGTRLLDAGLGQSAHFVSLTGHADATTVTILAVGAWPVGLGPESPVRLPVQSEVTIRRQVWVP